MFHHKIDRETPHVVIFHWLLLSFVGGNLNSGGLLAYGKFVSHVTGFYTLFGQSVADLRWDSAFGMLSIPLYFLIGVMVAAFLVERPIHRKEAPHYILVMALVCLCLSGIIILGHLGAFGAFGETRFKTVYLSISLLAMASGLQNGAVSVASGHTVRIMHMTGNTTDLGIGIVRTLCMSKHSLAHADEVRAMKLRAGIIAAFATGSVAGAALFVRYRYDGFLLPAGICLYTLIWEAYFNRRTKRNGVNTLVFIPESLKQSDNRV
jgi:uncharacterized membrane protein YoaK (UPF0700 family)